MSQSTEQLGVGTAQEQSRQQRIFLPPGKVDLIDDSDHFLRPWILHTLPELFRQSTAVEVPGRRTETCFGGAPWSDRLNARYLCDLTIRVRIVGTVSRRSGGLPNFINGCAALRVRVRWCWLFSNPGAFPRPFDGAVHARESPSYEIPRIIRGSERTEARYGGGVVEVPLALRDTDEIANGRIGSPGAAQRSTRQLSGHASLEK
jgi:hypothetical protein